MKVETQIIFGVVGFFKKELKAISQSRVTDYLLVIYFMMALG